MDEGEEDEHLLLETKISPLQVAGENLRRAGPGYILVAKDIAFWKKGRLVYSKAFDVHRLIEFVLTYCRAGTERYHHEAIKVDAPCHPYFDVDIKASDDGGEKIKHSDEIFTEILRAGREAIRVRLGQENIPDPKILSCTRPGKFSKHVIFDTIWMANPRHVAALFDGIPNIDRQPYGGANTKTCVWMRMPYSEKLEEPGYPVLPDGVPPPAPGGPRWPALDPRDVIPYMITWFGGMGGDSAAGPPGDISTILAPIPTKIYRMAECYATNSASSPSSPGDEASLSRDKRIKLRAKRILEFLNVTRGPFTASEPVIRPGKVGWSCYVDPGIFCASNGTRHQRQRTYIGSDDCRAVYYRCPDPKCRIRIYFPEDFTMIAYRQ